MNADYDDQGLYDGEDDQIYDIGFFGKGKGKFMFDDGKSESIEENVRW